MLFPIRHVITIFIFSSFLKKSELISAVWLGGWGTSFEELGRDRESRVRELLESKFYLSDFNNIGVDLG
jgi:hypothetical protein